MCGINGAIGANREIVAHMDAVTRHRGPDREAVSEHRDWTLGLNRLAVIDLSPTGDQPMTSADGRFTIAYNGETYNFRELKEKLEAEGTRFRGNSDTEVIAEGYARWGQRVLEKLRGMWALAIRDNESGELLLARDPFGIKPLYLFNDGRTIAFSSEIRGLLAHPSVSREINPDAIRDLLLLGYTLAPRTILKHARALLPGEEIVLDASGRERRRQIQSLTSDQSSAVNPPTDDELQNLLEDSVRRHLIADVPIGLFFSGGIDSSILAMLLQKIKAPLTAYHLAIEGRSDTPYARRIAETAGLNFREIPFAAGAAPQWLERFWRMMDQPSADSSLLPTFVVAEHAAREVKVVLSGEGGDELFGGYRHHPRLMRLQLKRDHQRGSRLVSSALETFPAFIPLIPKIRGFLRRERTLTGDAIGAYFAETAIGAGLISENAARRAIDQRLAARETPDGTLALDRLIYLPDDLLMKIDVATMNCSLEGRVPFLDREVFRQVGSTSMSWRRTANAPKAPLQRLLRTSFPREILERPKTGFSIPLSSYLFPHERPRLGEAADWFPKTYPDVAPALASVLRWGRKKRERWEVLERTTGHVLYAVLTLFVFHEKLKSR